MTVYFVNSPGGRISPHKLLDARSDVYTRSPDVPLLNSAMARQSLAESVHKYRSQPMESNWEAPSPPAPVKEVLDPTETCGLCTETERGDPKQSNLKGEEKEEGFVLPEGRSQFGCFWNFHRMHGISIIVKKAKINHTLFLSVFPHHALLIFFI